MSGFLTSDNSYLSRPTMARWLIAVAVQLIAHRSARRRRQLRPRQPRREYPPRLPKRPCGFRAVGRLDSPPPPKPWRLPCCSRRRAQRGNSRPASRLDLKGARGAGTTQSNPLRTCPGDVARYQADSGMRPARRPSPCCATICCSCSTPWATALKTFEIAHCC